jgi:hypothetical protein
MNWIKANVGKGGKGKKAQLAQSKFDILPKKSFICCTFGTWNQINYVSKLKNQLKDEDKICFFFSFFVNSSSISPFRIMKCITSPSRCKQGTMSQHDYLRKGVHVFLPNFFFHMNEFWNNFFVTCYHKCL